MRAPEQIRLPDPSPGTRRILEAYRFGGRGNRPKAYLQAGLHADEWPGLLVLHHLRRLLERAETSREVRGEVIVVPFANPIGLAQRLHRRLLGRFELDAGGNFNRDFPDLTSSVESMVRARLGQDVARNTAEIRTALIAACAELPAAPERNALKAALLRLSIDADIVLDLHCDREALLHIYASRHHQRQAAELGAQLGARAVLLERDAGGSPFDESNAGPWWKLRERLGDNPHIEAACFAATVELRGRLEVSDRIAAEDASNLYRFLQRAQIVEGDPGSLPEPGCPLTPLEGVDVLVAPAPGIIVYRKELGETVRSGEIVAELVDLVAKKWEDARIPIESRTTGILFARNDERLVYAGDKVGKVAGAAPLAHRQAGRLLED